MTLEREIYASGRPAVQHRLAQAAAGGAVRRAEAAGRRRRPRPAPAPTPTCWRSWPATTRCRPRSSSTGSIAKLKSTYVDALPEMVYPETGRVHASFNQAVAATGRLSSSDPNLQNIPVRTEEGREIRSAFVPGQPRLGAAGGRLLADRAAGAGPFLRRRDALRRPLPAMKTSTPGWPARSTACPAEGVTGEMRRRAKAVNFGVIYGQSPFGLAQALGIEQDEAAEFIDSYFAGYPGVEEFLAQVLAECRKKGYVRTILGRRRAIRGVRPDAGSAAEPGRADRHQHGDPRLGGGPDQAGHDRHPPPAAQNSLRPRRCCCKSTTN